MFKAAFVVVLMLGIATIVWGRSSADLSAKYRQITSYELRPDVVMTPKCAVEGQVCEMVLEKQRHYKPESLTRRSESIIGAGSPNEHCRKQAQP